MIGAAICIALIFAGCIAAVAMVVLPLVNPEEGN